MEKSLSEEVASGRIPAFIDRTVNLTLACLLAVPSTLVVIFIYVLYLLFEERPRPRFFYSGARLGRNRKPYMMYKIRTLRDDPQFENEGVILPPGSHRELKLGKFLRDSRLDELPQLWNVIRGEMTLVGPRPVRPVVYEQLCKEIPNLDYRFQVKPGLTGYAQFLTPSHTPKRIRFAIDNYFVAQGRHLGRNLILIVWTVWVVFRKSAQDIIHRTVTMWKMFSKRGRVADQRELPRYRNKQIWIQLRDMGFSNDKQPLIPIFDINYHAVSFVSDQNLQDGQTLYFYLAGCKECEKGQMTKKARCCGYVYKTHPVPDGSADSTRYVVFYEPVSPRHRYLVDHYVLHETVA